MINIVTGRGSIGETNGSGREVDVGEPSNGSDLKALARMVMPRGHWIGRTGRQGNVKSLSEPKPWDGFAENEEEVESKRQPETVPLTAN
jgi:hypothetical protein